MHADDHDPIGDDLHHDPLAPARGLVYGVLLGMVLWLLIIGAWAVLR